MNSADVLNYLSGAAQEIAAHHSDISAQLGCVPLGEKLIAGAAAAGLLAYAVPKLAKYGIAPDNIRSQLLSESNEWLRCALGRNNH